VNVRGERNPNGHYGFGILSRIAETKPHRGPPCGHVGAQPACLNKDFAGNRALVVGITVI
jgi:hypothetical protein